MDLATQLCRTHGEMTLKYYLKLEATEIERLRNGGENNIEIDNIKIGEKLK
jgi:hypothetical protein